MSALVPCEKCLRHIRADHDACPFCAARVPEGFAKRAIPAATRRMDRFATFSFATALTVAACGGIAEGTNDGNGSDAGTVKTDSGFGSDAGGVMPSYGGGRFGEDAGVIDSGKPSDGGKLDSGIVEDDGGNVALYGLPWPDDASIDVNVQPPYGHPPFDAGVPGDD